MTPPEHVYSIHIPTRTILKVLTTILLVWAALKLWPELVFLSISLLLAVALDPMVAHGERRGIQRGISVMILAVFLLGLAALFLAVAAPPLAEQVAKLIADLPALRERVLSRVPPNEPVLLKVIDQVFALPSSPDFAAYVNQPLVWGKLAVSTVMTTFFVVITTLYLIIDGKRLYAWLLAYVPRHHRQKMAETVPEVSNVVYAYVRGQAFTSLLFGVFVAILLWALKVPAVLPLAFLAAAFDVIPVVGIILAVVPAALLAMTVSPIAAIAVVGGYLGYHQIETYIIVPRVYGNTLRLSTLTVLLALVVGSALQGIIGAILVLPLVAAYPIIERIWLRGYLSAEVIRDHTALAKGAENGTTDAVDAVLLGVGHPDEPAGSSRLTVPSDGVAVTAVDRT